MTLKNLDDDLHLKMSPNMDYVHHDTRPICCNIFDPIYP